MDHVNNKDIYFYYFNVLWYGSGSLYHDMCTILNLSPKYNITNEKSLGSINFNVYLNWPSFEYLQKPIILFNKY